MVRYPVSMSTSIELLEAAKWWRPAHDGPCNALQIRWTNSKPATLKNTAFVLATVIQQSFHVAQKAQERLRRKRMFGQISLEYITILDPARYRGEMLPNVG